MNDPIENTEREKKNIDVTMIKASKESLTMMLLRIMKTAFKKILICKYVNKKSSKSR